MNAMWVAADGSWGDSAIELFDVSGWSEDDFDELAEASDDERLEVAKAIRERNQAN